MPVAATTDVLPAVLRHFSANHGERSRYHTWLQRSHSDHRVYRIRQTSYWLHWRRAGPIKLHDLLRRRVLALVAV